MIPFLKTNKPKSGVFFFSITKMCFKAFVDSPFYLAFVAYDISASYKYSFSLGEIKMLQVIGLFYVELLRVGTTCTWEQGRQDGWLSLSCHPGS